MEKNLEITTTPFQIPDGLIEFATLISKLDHLPTDGSLFFSKISNGDVNTFQIDFCKSDRLDLPNMFDSPWKSFRMEMAVSDQTNNRYPKEYTIFQIFWHGIMAKMNDFHNTDLFTTQWMVREYPEGSVKIAKWMVNQLANAPIDKRATKRAQKIINLLLKPQ